MPKGHPQTIQIGKPISELPPREGDYKNDQYKIREAMEMAVGKWIPLKCSSAQVATKRNASIRGGRWFKELGAESATRGDTIYVRLPDAV